MHWLTECMHVSHRYTYILCKDSTSAFYNCFPLVYALAFTQLAAQAHLPTGDSWSWQCILPTFTSYLYIYAVN